MKNKSRMKRAAVSWLPSHVEVKSMPCDAECWSLRRETPVAEYDSGSSSLEFLNLGFHSSFTLW